MNFEQFINDQAIPKNWEILSARLDMNNQTVEKQRRKIIGEILEYSEAAENFRASNSEQDYREMCFELADIALAICSLLHIQERRYVQSKHPFATDAESMIMRIICRASSEVLSGLREYTLLLNIDLIGFMKEKMEYNRTRKDW